MFDDLFRNMVAAGEAGGVLDEILLRLAEYIEKADALKRKVQSAMVYPAVVLTVAVGATAFMLIFIIPTFAKMFTDFGGELPLPTKIVLIASNILRALLVAGRCWRSSAAFVALPALLRHRERPAGRSTASRIKMPVLGDVLLKGAVARFTRTLGTLIASGVPDPRGSRDHRPHGGQQGDRRGHHERPRLDPRRRDRVRAAQEPRACSRPWSRR